MMLYQADCFMLISTPIGISVTLKAAVSANCFSKRKTSAKLIADAFSAKSAVVDRLHDYVGCNAVCRLAVANYK